MKANRTTESINKRCEVLERHGFTINHEDSNVSLGDLIFDFSAIELTTVNIIKVVAKKAHNTGLVEGHNDIKQKLKRLLEPEEE